MCHDDRYGGAHRLSAIRNSLLAWLAPVDLRRQISRWLGTPDGDQIRSAAIPGSIPFARTVRHLRQLRKAEHAPEAGSIRTQIQTTFGSGEAPEIDN
jgi:hypothetical protein